MKRHRFVRTRSSLQNRRFILLVFALLVLTLLLILRFQGMNFGTVPTGGSLGTLLVASSVLMVFYFGIMLWMTGYFHHRPGGTHESKMLSKVVRTLSVFIRIGRRPSESFCKRRKKSPKI